MAKLTRTRTRASAEANKLLAAAREKDSSLLAEHLEPVDLPFAKILYQPEQDIDHLYFPRSGVVSAVKGFQNGDVIEVATIGPEGIVGVPLLLGARTLGSRHIVQVAGHGVRIEAGVFQRLIEQMPDFRALLLRSTMALLHQVSQTAACNRAHSVDERCARWLLMTHDRVNEPSFSLTQEFLAQMLGVHRPTVSVAAGMLQKAGMISYVRGKIKILDRAALEAASCECYAVIAEQYEALLRPQA
jgi:CRP-like cAMP-binding protein